MAGAITAASIKYGEPFVTKVGGILFSATNIETSGTAEEYEAGGVELKPEKLGLTDGLISVPPAEGALETASGFAGAIWCNPLISLNKEVYEEGKEVKESFWASITMIKSKPFLRCYVLPTAGAEKVVVEMKTATKVKVKSMSVTVFAFGR